jgi:hypothetical protein
MNQCLSRCLLFGALLSLPLTAGGLKAEPHSKEVSPDESDVTETPLEKSGAIRQEFIRVLRLTGCNSNAELILSVCWTVHCILIPARRC